MTSNEAPKPIIHATLEAAGYPGVSPNAVGYVAVNLGGNSSNQEEKKIDTRSLRPAPPYTEREGGIWKETGSGEKVKQTRPEPERDTSEPGEERENMRRRR